MKIRLNAYDPKKDKEVFAGIYNAETKTFVKNVTKRHYMILEVGYGIQLEVMDNLARWGCKKIEIRTKTLIYTVLFETWYKQGNHKNYGHGEQVFFPVRFMNKEEK